MTKAICPDCGRVQAVFLDSERVRVLSNGISVTFVPASDLVVKCKTNCGYVGVWKVEQSKWETSISRHG